MKIAVGGIAHETNTFSTVPTTIADFSRVDGRELVADEQWEELERHGHQLFPVFGAHATPSGRVTREAFDALLTELLEGIRKALPVDGVLLLLHGAMEVEQIGDGETALCSAVRRLVGPRPLIAVTLDLHANLAPQVVELVDIVVALRTAPHRDAVETRRRCVQILLRCLESESRPVSRLVALPLLVTGEAAVTEAEPARSLYAMLPEVDRRPGVLVSSLLIGCAWTDSPFTRVAAVVTALDASSAELAARDVAERAWAARDRFTIDSKTAPLDEAIDLAMYSAKRPVFISDSGDNTTAGAAGDLPIVLASLVSQNISGALVAGITDPVSAARCAQAGTGSAVRLSIGAILDTVNGRPFECEADVIKVQDELDPGQGRVVVRIGGVDVVLQSDRRPFTELGHFAAMGIDPGRYALIVVKEGYLFPELRDYAPAHVLALTPGFADQRLERLPFLRLPRPIHPLDLDVRWP